MELSFVRKFGEDTGPESLYLAKLKLSDEEELVSVKEVRVNADESSFSEAAIFREAAVLMSLRGSRWMPDLKFYFRHRNRHFLGTGLPGGYDLHSYLERKATLSISEARLFTGQLVLAIECLHSFGFIHRNLKPETLWIDGGHLRLTGFNLCHKAGERIHFDNLPVDYSPPEILTDPGPCSPAVDAWSVGAILYEMLYGGPPFSDNSRDRNKTIYRIIHCERYLWFPPHKDPDASLANELIRSLLKPESHRIPIKDVKTHAFFRSVDWQDLRLPDA